MKKRILSLIICLCLISGHCAFAQSIDITVSNGFGKATSTVSVLWSDDYFSLPSDEYNHSLAQCSAALSGAVYIASFNKSLETPLVEMGFDNISIFYSSPTREMPDTVTYAFASKELSDGTALCLIIIKGTGSNAEWYSNFNIATGSVHQGFSVAADLVEQSFKEYTAANEHENVKVLVTGHSRGAAVANMLGARLNKVYGKERVYAYTFATPSVTCEDFASEEYSNIFNIINPEDFVTSVPLKLWGYKRYGVDLFLPTKNIDTYGNYPVLSNRMKVSFKRLTGEEFDGFEDGTKKIDTLVARAEALAPTVEEYYNTTHTLMYPNFIAENAEYATTSDYFNYLAAFCAEGDVNALAAMGKALIGDFSPISAFFITHSGAGIGDFKFDAGVWCAHCPATYISYLLTNSEKELFGMTSPCPFTDISPTDSYYEEILFSYTNRLISGVSDTEFSPDTTTTRAMIVTLLHRAAGLPELSGTNTFFDVKDDHWYTDAIVWAENNAVAQGYGNGNFGPDDTITREQLATLLYRFASLSGFSLDYKNTLPPDYSVSTYAQVPFEWAYSKGFMDISKPSDSAATRAEAAASLSRLIIAN